MPACWRKKGRRRYGADIMSAVLDGSRLESSLSGLVAFVRAAEARSFVVAGRRLGVSASAIGKSVARLEGRLGVRLLNRTTRSISLTEEGAVLLERAAAVLDELRVVEEELAGSTGEPRGRVRLSVPDGFGQFVLAPALPRLTARLPEIALEIHFDDRVRDPVEESYDLVVRIAGRLADRSSLVARRLGPHRFVVCASPAYLDQRGRPLRPGDLAAHQCIRFTFSTTGRIQPWWFNGGGETIEIRPPGRLALNSNAAMLRAVLAGQGIAYLPSYVVAEAVREGSLLPVLDEHLVPHGSIWAVWPRRRRTTTKVRAIVDFLVTLEVG